MTQNEKIAVIGLGYVGLPVAIGFAKHYDHVVGYDINRKRVDELNSDHDHTGEASLEELKASKAVFTHNPKDMQDCTFFIVTVPTPITPDLRPDLRPLQSACQVLGPLLKPNDVVVFESTVYPGLTDEICGPWLAESSGLKLYSEIKLGYSPERINPGDTKHKLESIVKVVSGQDAETLDRVAEAYGRVVKAGIHRAPSIAVAEAAKVIENTQRDLNIALMNELSMLFDRLGIRTQDVLAAAGTKWNFLKFTPGLVGGHCIGVDPYYLTARAKQVGYDPQVILAGRRINDAMGEQVAKQAIKMLIRKDVIVRKAKIGILGLTFKEDVPDARNSQVPKIIKGLEGFGITPLVHDPMIDSSISQQHYGIDLVDWADMKDLDALIIAVGHADYKVRGLEALLSLIKPQGVFMDIKSLFTPQPIEARGYAYWSL